MHTWVDDACIERLEGSLNSINLKDMETIVRSLILKYGIDASLKFNAGANDISVELHE